MPLSNQRSPLCGVLGAASLNVTAAKSTNSIAFSNVFTCTTFPACPVKLLGVTSVKPRKSVEISTNSTAFSAVLTDTTLPACPVKLLGVTSVKPKKLVDIVVNDKLPAPSVLMTCSAVPSAVGSVKALLI